LGAAFRLWKSWRRRTTSAALTLNFSQKKIRRAQTERAFYISEKTLLLRRLVLLLDHLSAGFIEILQHLLRSLLAISRIRRISRTGSRVGRGIGSRRRTG
jgi:hypothetical protein